MVHDGKADFLELGGDSTGEMLNPVRPTSISSLWYGQTDLLEHVGGVGGSLGKHRVLTRRAQPGVYVLRAATATWDHSLRAEAAAQAGASGGRWRPRGGGGVASGGGTAMSTANVVAAKAGSRGGGEGNGCGRWRRPGAVVEAVDAAVVAVEGGGGSSPARWWQWEGQWKRSQWMRRYKWSGAAAHNEQHRVIARALLLQPAHHRPVRRLCTRPAANRRALSAQWLERHPAIGVARFRGGTDGTEEMSNPV